MGLFNIFTKNKEKVENKVPEYFSITSNLLGEIYDLALRYTINEEVLDTYSEEHEDVIYLNNSRSLMEECLENSGNTVEEYYNNEYTKVEETVEENKIFSYSLDALISIFNNSLDLYSQDKAQRDNLNLCYEKCNKELIKVKEILSDDEKIQRFTGITPIEKNDKKEIKYCEEIAIETETMEKNVKVDNIENVPYSEDIDGDIIIDTENMKVYFIRKSRNENDEMCLNICIKNKLDKDAIFEVKDVSVDGQITIPEFKCNVESRKIVYDKITFTSDITDLMNVKGTFVMKENISNKLISEVTTSIL